MSEITTLLRAAGAGDREAADQVVALLYDDLHRLAKSRLRGVGGLTLLDTTSLVHESYLRIQRSDDLAFVDRRYFLAYAAKVMRTILIDAVRARQAARRGGDVEHVPLETEAGGGLAAQDDEALRVHEALEELAAVEPRLAQVVEMRYFGGLAESEIADCLAVTERTVQRDWQKARLFLSMALK